MCVCASVHLAPGLLLYTERMAEILNHSHFRCNHTTQSPNQISDCFVFPLFTFVTAIKSCCALCSEINSLCANARAKGIIFQFFTCFFSSPLSQS